MGPLLDEAQATCKNKTINTIKNQNNYQIASLNHTTTQNIKYTENVKKEKSSNKTWLVPNWKHVHVNWFNSIELTPLEGKQVKPWVRFLKPCIQYTNTCRLDMYMYVSIWQSVCKWVWTVNCDAYGSSENGPH